MPTLRCHTFQDVSVDTAPEGGRVPPPGAGCRRCTQALGCGVQGPAIDGGLHFPKMNSESSQAGEMASAQPEAGFPSLLPHSSTVLLCKPAWPESENGGRLLGVLGGRLPSSEVLRQLPAWSSSSEPATRKSDKGPGTSWPKYWASSGSEAREACGGRQGRAQRRTRGGSFSAATSPVFPRTLRSNPPSFETAVAVDATSTYCRMAHLNMQ